MAGHISVPLYPTLQSSSIKQILDHCEAKILFVGKLEEWDDQKVDLHEYKKINFPSYTNSDAQSFSTFVENKAPLEKVFQANKDDVATIIYTSGTTECQKELCIHLVVFHGGH